MTRVLILSGHPLFAQGVESLLRGQPGIEVVGREMDVRCALERIRTLQLDVIIVDSDVGASATVPALLVLLQAGLGAKIIGVSLQDNTASICYGEQRVIGCVEDLVRAIGHDEGSC